MFTLTRPVRKPFRWRALWPFGCFLVAMPLAGCAAPLSVQAASSGRHAELRTAMERERCVGKLDYERITRVARAVGEREIRQAPEADALARIEEARACSRPLATALEDRAERQDDAAGAAMLAILDDRKESAGRRASLVEKYGASSNGFWRAVAARAAVGCRLGTARRKFLVDADERVRMAALRAALETPDPADRDVLLEAARLDPNPVAQAVAARALGAIADEDAVVRLRDLYTNADEGLRQSIVDGWALPLARSKGGRRELIRVAQNEQGAYAIEASAMLLQSVGDAEARDIGKSALLRGFEQGLARNRVMAIGRAPIADTDVRTALTKASRASDVPVKVAALARLTEINEARVQAFTDLRKLSLEGSKDARKALARLGDPGAVDAVAKDLASPNRETRLEAMNILVDAGRFASAADLLADADPQVRMRTACAVLSARAP